MLRFQLISNALGTLNIDRNDPIDINALAKTVKRSEQWSGVIYQIMFDVEFIKQAREFLKAAYELDGGIDALVISNVYQLDTNARRWKIWGTGQVDMNRWELDEIILVVNLEQTGNERRIINLMENDLDINTTESEDGVTLPELTEFEVPHHSKKIQKESTTTPSDSGEYQQLGIGQLTIPATGQNNIHLDLNWYGQFERDETLIDELTEMFGTPYGFTFYPQEVPEAPQQEIDGAGTEAEYIDYLSVQYRKDLRNPVYEADEAGLMKVYFKMKYKFTVDATNPERDDTPPGDIDVNGGSGCLGHPEATAWYEHRDKDDNIISIEEIGRWTVTEMPGDHAESEFETKEFTKTDIVVNVGDKFFVYPHLRVWGSYDAPNPFPLGKTGHVIHDATIEADESETIFQFQNLTETESSVVKGPLIYEAVERCVQYYTNQVDIFRSTLLGRTDLGYDEDGEASMIQVYNGYRLRGMDSTTTILVNFGLRQVFMNLKYLLDFLNARYCIGFGFEIRDGKQVFVLEKLQYFFRKDQTILSLGKVFGAKRRVNPKMFHNRVTCGWSTNMNTRQTNGVDEFNTLRQFNIPVVNTKGELKIDHDMITAGHLIEGQRRLRGKTQDSEYDDRLFATVVIRDGEGFKTKTNEGYDLIENYISPETAYNLDLAPSECLIAWLPVIASSLIRSKRKIVKFNSGKVNYRIRRRKTGEVEIIADNGSFDVTYIEPIWDNENYIIPDIKLTRQQMEQVIANPYGVVEFEDKDGNLMEGFISYDSGIEQEEPKNKGAFHLLRVHRQIITS